MAAGADEDGGGGELWTQERGHQGEEDCFREDLKVEDDFLSLDPASGSGPAHRARAGLLWPGLGTYPTRPLLAAPGLFPPGTLLDISHLFFLGTAIVLTGFIPKPQ